MQAALPPSTLAPHQSPTRATPCSSPTALALVPTKPPAPRSTREPGSLGPGLALPGRNVQAGSLGLSGVGGTTARLLPGKGGRAGERAEGGLGFLVCLDSKISRWRVRGPRAHNPALGPGCPETPGAWLKIVLKVSEPVGVTGNESVIQEFLSFLSHVVLGSDLVLTDTACLPQPSCL